MFTRSMRICLLAVAASACVVGLASFVPARATQADKSGNEQFFETRVRAILEEHCVKCHAGEKPAGGLNLSSRTGLIKGSLNGPVVNLKTPSDSKLLKAVKYLGPQMPPSGRLPQQQVEALEKWVELGAPWPKALMPKAAAAHGAPQVTAETRNFWSFKPIRRPPIPVVKVRGWVRNPIDSFILSPLEKERIGPNPPAERAALLRRAYYDLIGLPPTPEQVRSFLADNSPDAFAKVVDTLLASPQYGEKWGRHWLDLVRYAETNSYERDGPKPHVWRYRDYVIKSFNEDKPYNEFITEQLAGDEMPERTADRIIATGYYRLGLWDDEPADPEQALYDDLDDIVSTTGQVILGLTVGCARCHDHKIDPLPQKDYYRFLAFFRGIRRYGVRSDETVHAASLRSIASADEEKRFAAEAAEHRRKLRSLQGPISDIENKIIPDFSPVEKEEFQDQVKRVGLARKRVPKVLTQEEFDQYVKLRDERRRLMQNPPRGLQMALSVKEVGKDAPDTFVLMRGNPHSPGEKVACGYPSVLTPPEPQITPAPSGESPGRRIAFAEWVTSAQNPLTARVIANRVWQYHFGRGIVRTSNDFGLQGARPTHAELLDWLASELVEPTVDATGRRINGKPATAWTLKRLHRLIMLSNSYRMSSRVNKAALAKDPANDLFWRFDMRRIQAEEVRDSILAVNGSLNPKMGGPSIFAEIPQAVLAGQSMPGAGWGKSSPEEERRRSIYIHVKRSLITPIIASFDGPETDFTCPVRFVTTQPTQALGMMNSEWVNKQARVFAEYVKKGVGENPTEQVRFALWRSLQREPTAREVDRGVRRIIAMQKEDGISADESLRLFCLVALNLNEFVYLD